MTVNDEETISKYMGRNVIKVTALINILTDILTSDVTYSNIANRYINDKEVISTDHIILSLLLIKSMNVYEIRLYIQHSLSTVCSDSLGSIQAAIKKLLSMRSIEVYEYVENGKLKKQYSITPNGVEQFTAWISTPMNLQKVRNMEEGKFFFLGMASKETRIRSLQGYIDSMLEEQEKFFDIQKLVESMRESVIQTNVDRIRGEEHLSRDLLAVSGEETLEKVVENIYAYQVYNLEYGLKRLQDDIEFYQTILAKELKNSNADGGI